jgi:hypothetical protein
MAADMYTRLCRALVDVAWWYCASVASPCFSLLPNLLLQEQAHLLTSNLALFYVDQLHTPAACSRVIAMLPLLLAGAHPA